jgi:hypothetical protein
MVDAARLCFTLSPMTPEEADRLGVDENDRRSLIRMDSAKVNIAPPARRQSGGEVSASPLMWTPG